MPAHRVLPFPRQEAAATTRTCCLDLDAHEIMLRAGRKEWKRDGTEKNNQLVMNEFFLCS